tara:strand:- start:513 stop:1220 length:708 start_codon:yes stop_codon:yes gene_type:complete
MRWGKPTKNTRRRDPRYFLNEDMQPQEQETEEEFLQRFEKVVSELSNEELLDVLSEAEGDEPSDVVSVGGTQDQRLGQKPRTQEQLYLSEEARKYMINFLRRRIMGVLSFKLRLILLGASKLTFPFSWVAMAALRYAGFSLRKATSTSAIDKAIEKQLTQYLPGAKEALYPGDTNLKKIVKSIVQGTVRQIKGTAEVEVKKIESLPEPEREETVQGISQQLEALKKEMQNEPVSS